MKQSQLNFLGKAVIKAERGNIIKIVIKVNIYRYLLLTTVPTYVFSDLQPVCIKN